MVYFEYEYILEDIKKEQKEAEKRNKEDEKKYPLKRYGKPEDVANLAIYLLSDASTWMTGSSIKITGGEQ